ncbi:unnamed protein product [Heterobilharzia americana]|nr:unnamed protein product [Heterobilharzia americana]
MQSRVNENLTTPHCDNIVELTGKHAFHNCNLNGFSLYQANLSAFSKTDLRHLSETMFFAQLTHITRITLILLNSVNKMVNETDLEIEKKFFKPFLSTRGLHFVVTEVESLLQEVNFTIRIYGCKATSDPLTFDSCLKKFVPLNSEGKSFMSILSTREFLFHCGMSSVSIGKVAAEKRCFMTTSSVPLKWTDAGPKISEIIMLLQPSNIVVGRSGRDKSILISKDMGKSWLVVNYLALKELMSESSNIIHSNTMSQSPTENKNDTDITRMICDPKETSEWKLAFLRIAKTVTMVDMIISARAVLLLLNNAKMNHLFEKSG